MDRVGFKSLQDLVEPTLLFDWLQFLPGSGEHVEEFIRCEAASLRIRAHSTQSPTVSGSDQSSAMYRGIARLHDGSRSADLALQIFQQTQGAFEVAALC